MLQLEDILGTNDHAFQTIWFAANHSLSLSSRRNRITKRIIMGVNVERSCKYLSTLEAPLTLPIQSCLLSGLVKVHHQQCDLHYAAVKHLWQNIQRDLTTSQNTSIDCMRTMARMESITLPDNNNTAVNLSLDPVHSFENMIDKDNSRWDWFFNLRPSEVDCSHIYRTDGFDASLLESPSLNLLPSARLDIDDLEFNIQDTISADDAEGSIGSETWRTARHSQEREQNLFVSDFTDEVWQSREHEEGLAHIRGPGAFVRPLQNSLPGINEVVSDSTIIKSTSQGSVTDDQAQIGSPNHSLKTDECIQVLEDMGVYLDNGVSEDHQCETGASYIRRRYTGRRPTSTTEIELTSEQLANLLSENHYHHPNKRLVQKKHLEDFRKNFYQLLSYPCCAAYAMELKEIWTSKENDANEYIQEVPRSATEFIEELQMVIAPESIGQMRDENEVALLAEHPEDARGYLDEISGDIFLWNLPDYQSEESYGTGESRAGSDAKSLVSMSSTGLIPIYGYEARSNLPREFPTLNSLPERGEEWSSVEDNEFLNTTEINSTIKAWNSPYLADIDTYNFFMYTRRLLSNTDNNVIVFNRLFPDMTYAKRAAISQAFINMLSI
ncbi:hypothetical protein BGW37DRAFT_559038 [Umbelopsis sp. PMI_123]|nr:hypothetical protein BGW37DRAFT_559038 [Umbelopsis sp. PMI_123]